MLDIRKRAAFSDLLLAVTALALHRRTRTRTPARKPILLRRSVTGPMPRHRRLCASSDIETVAPMGFGSVLGAVIGGL